jgi:hypothetical protein
MVGQSVAGQADSLALTVHGPVGVVDLVVPSRASCADVANEYAAQARMPVVPRLHTRLGAVLDPDLALVDAGITAGAVLVAVGEHTPTMVRGQRQPRAARPAPEEPGRLSVLWFSVASVLALLAGWYAAHLDDTDQRTVAIWLLGGAAAVSVLPIGRFVRHRTVAAPTFAFAAAFAAAWDPAPERLPTVLGLSALTAAVAAAVARALDRRAEEALRIWMVTGVACFLIAIGGALAGAAPQIVWAILVILAMLAARFVPTLAVDVPDQFLIDIERLAVSAWSARDRPVGRRGRIVVPRPAVAAVAESGTRTIVAASAAVAAVTAVSAPLVLATATLPIDRIGARCLVGFAGAALLLAARSYRNAAARGLLRVAGLICWVTLAVVLIGVLGDNGMGFVIGGAIALSALLVVVAVAVGRGWRSAWWARRAEVAEGISGAFALGAVVVAVGLFRRLWELTGQGLTP